MKVGKVPVGKPFCALETGYLCDVEIFKLLRNKRVCVCIYICCNIVSNTIISLGILNIGGCSLILLRSRYNNTTLGSNGLGCSQHVLMVQGVLLIAGELLELCIKNSMMKYSFSYISRGEHTVL